MDGQEGERNRVAEFNVPAQEPILGPVCADVGHVLQCVRLVIVGDTTELLRPKPAAPAMGSRHELDADIPRHRIERYPEAHVLFAVDAVVGLIVVPRRELAGARLLHQDVLMEHADGA